jgi:hypothetical protein
MKLGEILIQMGHITEAQLTTALERQRDSSERLGALMIRLGYITERKLINALAHHLRLEFCDLNVPIQEFVVSLIDRDVAVQLEIMPFALSLDAESKLFVATYDPTDTRAREMIESSTGFKVIWLLAPRTEILKTLAKYYGAEAPREAPPPMLPGEPIKPKQKRPIQIFIEKSAKHLQKEIQKESVAIKEAAIEAAQRLQEQSAALVKDTAENFKTTVVNVKLQSAALVEATADGIQTIKEKVVSTVEQTFASSTPSDAPKGPVLIRKFTHLGEALVQKGLVSQQQVDRALEIEVSHGLSVGTALIATGAIGEKELVEFLAESSGVPSIDLDEFAIDPEVAVALPLDLAQRCTAIAVNRVGNSLMVAMADPACLEALEDLRFVSGKTIEVLVASEAGIGRSIAKAFNLEPPQPIGKIELPPPPPAPAPVEEVKLLEPVEMLREGKVIPLADLPQAAKIAWIGKGEKTNVPPPAPKAAPARPAPPANGWTAMKMPIAALAVKPVNPEDRPPLLPAEFLVELKNSLPPQLRDSFPPSLTYHDTITLDVPFTRPSIV